VLRKGAKRVVLKLGEKGAMVADGATRVHIPPHPCRPVDATGAGDCFGGALIARLIAGDPLTQAARYAGVAAALSTQGYGAVAPIPQAQDVLAAIGSGD
jgi:2-dehydro-3-deoxygluconokinase